MSYPQMAARDASAAVAERARHEPFWRATKERRLTYQRCDDCGAVVFYPRAHCTSCLGGSLSWHVSAGRGAVYSYSVIRQSYHPFFRTRVPFAVAWIDLDEGPRISRT